MEYQVKGENTIFYVMGVSGCGKSTVGKLLAQRLGLPFADGDDFHPDANVEKMEAGLALDDTDRVGWLAAIYAFAKKQLKQQGVVIACSALKEKYRKQLSAGLDTQVVWVYLKGDYELILERMRSREDHFMPVSLLKSQFATLEEPSAAITVDIQHPPVEMVDKICTFLNDSGR